VSNLDRRTFNVGSRLFGARARPLRPDATLRPLGGESLRPPMLDLILGGIVALLIAIYLVFALLYPEKL
jgi:K+-transporting ATPase KdpF subunit